MKFSLSVATALLSIFASTTLAAQSEPFYLVLKSSNSKVNNKVLEACHEGAAIEGLCVSGSLSNAKAKYDTYRFNYTKSEPNYGILTYNLVTADNTESEPMSLFADPSTNVAIALFEPGYAEQYLGFDSKNQMYLESGMDDLVTPPTDTKTKKYYRWYACEYNFEGYVYDVLCWTYGIAKPQNPSCKSVQVQRVFKK